MRKFMGGVLVALFTICLFYFPAVSTVESADAPNLSGKWVGFQKDMELLLRFCKAVQLRSVGLHLLKNTGADIYPPVSIQVWGGPDKMHLKLLRTINPVASVKGDAPALFLEECSFAATRVNWIKLVARSVKKSPKWGNSPGKPGWIFTDEILFN